MPEARSRPAWAEVDLDAIRHNTAVLTEVAAPAAMCAVVKADGYGHGAVPVARAALAGGATWLAVAVVDEGTALRDAGIDAPILLLAEPPPEAIAEAVAQRLSLTVYTPEGVAAAAAASSDVRPTPVHLKVDTGMHRVGCAPDRAVALAQMVDRSPGLRLEGLWTHLAVAEDPAQDDFTGGQLRRFEEVRGLLARAGIRPEMLHAANSAAAMAQPTGVYDMVRCGIAIYGYAPGAAQHSPVVTGGADLRPALSLKARVSLVKEVDAGEGLSYGLRYRLPEPGLVATVPLGYADGVPRRLSEVGGEVLIHGGRYPMAGTVTMDQLLVDCGPASGVKAGDEVVLLGRQGSEEIWADHWARLLGTISYEIVCGVGPRVPRVFLGEDAAPGTPATTSASVSRI